MSKVKGSPKGTGLSAGSRLILRALLSSAALHANARLVTHPAIPQGTLSTDGCWGHSVRPPPGQLGRAAGCAGEGAEVIGAEVIEAEASAAGSDGLGGRGDHRRPLPTRELGTDSRRRFSVHACGMRRGQSVDVQERAPHRETQPFPCLSHCTEMSTILRVQPWGDLLEVRVLTLKT